MKKDTEQNTARLLSGLGLCARARAMIIGTPMVCDALRARQKPVLVLEAMDTSDNTHRKLCAKCSFYGVPLYRPAITVADLGHAVGKTGGIAAVAVTDDSFRNMLKDYLGTPIGFTAS